MACYDGLGCFTLSLALPLKGEGKEGDGGSSEGPLLWQRPGGVPQRDISVRLGVKNGSHDEKKY